jgi:two-component system phosphate regulon sensor histidine kinase PhoR
VWVVDDSPLDREHALRVLSGRYRVEAFEDGSAVLERMATGERPDVLVLDWVMPGVSGVDVCRFLRSQAEAVPTPVVLLTAQRETADVVEGLRAGANDYLGKPYAPEEMLARVEGLAHSRALLERASRAESSLRTLLASLPDAVLLVDPAGTVVFANDEAVRAFARAGRPLLQQPIALALPGLALDPTPGPTPGEPRDVELGGEYYAPLVRPAVEEAGVSYAVSLRNVTRKRQREVRRLDFYSMVAHDLRSPLSAMLMRVDWLLAGRRGALPPEARSDIQKVEARIRELVSMVNDFLDLARMESTGIAIQPEPLDMNAVATAAVEEYQHVAQAGRLTLELSRASEEACVEADRARVEQVLTNLLSNAIKFTPPGGRITVAVRTTAEQVETSVADTGRGIPPGAVPHIFNRYTRAADVPREITGTGLGLMIVREIVEAHGGTVGVESELGRGSTFRFAMRRAANCAPAAIA